MKHLLNITRQTRENFIRLIETSTIEELNEVPASFSNNIIWNFVHIMTSQQLLCYQLAGLNPIIDPAYILAYKKGTRPEGFVNAEEINTIKGLIRSTIDQLEIDLDNNLFVNYNAFTTSFGVELKSTNDAVQFFPVHDALHYGYALAIKKALNKTDKN
jgi:hypothetical protein